MAIDIERDELMTLNEAAKLLPAKNGKKPHLTTLYKWSVEGCGGCLLETVQVGGTRCTTRAALAEFFRQLTDRSTAGQAMRRLQTSNSRGRTKAAERAGKELEKAGV